MAQTHMETEVQERKSGLLTPEYLWKMGRIGNVSANATGTKAVYAVTYYDVAQNNSRSILYVLDLRDKALRCITPFVRKEDQIGNHITTDKSESGAVWLNVDGEERIAYLSAESGTNQLWTMKSDGSDRRQISHEPDDIVDFLFSPDSRQVILVKEVPLLYRTKGKRSPQSYGNGDQ